MGQEVVNELAPPETPKPSRVSEVWLLVFGLLSCVPHAGSLLAGLVMAAAFFSWARRKTPTWFGNVGLLAAFFSLAMNMYIWGLAFGLLLQGKK